MGYSGGRFVWYELATTDIESAKNFYASVVGWGTGNVSIFDSVYCLFTAGNEPVAGLMKLPPDTKRTDAVPQWIGYVGVEDVDAIVGQARQARGTVYVPPTEVPDVSRFSVIADPQGATLALIKGQGEAPWTPARPNTPGRVSWHELLTFDVDGAFDFYTALFGWQKGDAYEGPVGTYRQFAAGAETIGGIFSSPTMSLLPLWLYYFNVRDIDAAIGSVKGGGGEILHGPVTVPGGARIVQCSDPQGAIFALIDRHIRFNVGCWSGK